MNLQILGEEGTTALYAECTVLAKETWRRQQTGVSRKLDLENQTGLDQTCNI